MRLRNCNRPPGLVQDVHAGNLLVLEDGRVAFIDFGIVGRFSPDTWSGVSRLADGVAQEDFTVMAEVRQETPSSSGIR